MLAATRPPLKPITTRWLSLLGDYERRLPRTVDLEAAVPRTAAESAFWSALSAFLTAAGASDDARSSAEASLKLCELLDARC